MSRSRTAKKKATGKKPSTGNSVRSFSRRLKLWAGAAALALCAAGAAFTFVPEERVPDALEPVHTELLRVRNTAAAKYLPWISRYEDTAEISIPGTAPVRVYFAPSQKIREGLCEFIDSAKESIDLCIYDLDLREVAHSLTEAKKRGVSVQVVTDEDNAMLDAVESLKEAGIPVIPDNRPAIMHNKFVVVDSKYVWTGSFNFTVNGMRKNDNNALILESPQIAACYRSKFREYCSGRFGPKARQKTVGGRVLIGGSMPVIAAFSPSDGVEKLLLAELAGAKKEVRVMAFSFTSQKIAEELVRLKEQGVSVRGLFDRGQAGGKFSRDEELQRHGISVRLAPNPSGKMHHKVILIDGETVITGSYNFSKNAETSNDENILILKNREIAGAFLREFRRCWTGIKGYP